MLNESSVVGKTIFSDGKGKLFFGYYKTDDAVEFVDYKTWKKLSFKDVSKGDTNKERVIKAIVKNQKQFNKKVDFNMWAKKQKRSFEDTMDWFIQNGWVSNITKRGIKEGVEDVLSVNEGKKRFKRQDGIGKAKYTISFHDGKKKHKDGSDFFDIKIFNNKKDLSDFVGTLAKQGYKLTNESVNESASKEAMGIAALTGTRGSAVQDFIDKNRINSRKLFNALKKANLQGRMNFASALSGKPGNPNEKLTIKLFGENVNEGISVSDERHFGKKGIIIMIDDNGKKVSAIFKDKKNADKFNRNNPSDIKKLLDLAKKTKYPKAIDESVNEGKSFVVMFKVKKDINNRNVKPSTAVYSSEADAKKFLQSVEKDGGNGMITRSNVKGMKEAKFGYKDSTSSYINKHKDEYKVAEKLNKGNEVKFYDSLSQMEEKIGHPKFMIFLSNALRGYKVDMYKDPKIKNPQDAQEALYLLSK